MPTVKKSPPTLSKLDDLFLLSGEPDANPEPYPTMPHPAKPHNLPVNSGFEIIPFDLMDDYPDHPFRLYEGERESDMVDSIAANGILVPLILRVAGSGRYQILSGHNRKYAGIKAGLADGPAVIKRGISDADAMIYVIETNLMQRSFTDMTHSEKAAVIALHHSKLFSQGKRNDIFNELKMLENSHEYRENGTLPQCGEKLHSDKIVGEKYSLSKNTVARYLRINHLVQELRSRLDNGKIAFLAAVTLSFLKENEQKLLDKCLALNGFTIDMKKADTLRQYSEKSKMDEENTYMILTGELGQKPKPNRTPTVKVSKTVYAKYFEPSQSAKDIQDIVEKALDLYFKQTA